MEVTTPDGKTVKKVRCAVHGCTTLEVFSDHHSKGLIAHYTNAHLDPAHFVFYCHICGTTFAHRRLRVEHLRTVCDKGYKCNQCGKAFITERSLSEHVDIAHLGLRPFVCDKCGFTTGYRKHLIKHQRTKHGDHKLPGVSLYCEECGQGFVSQRALKAHKRARHDPNKRPKPEKERAQLMCDKCDFTTYSKRSLQHHTANLHEYNAQTDKIFCDICGLALKNKLSMSKHKRRFHREGEGAAANAANPAATATAAPPAKAWSAKRRAYQQQELIEGGENIMKSHQKMGKQGKKAAAAAKAALAVSHDNLQVSGSSQPPLLQQEHLQILQQPPKPVQSEVVSLQIPTSQQYLQQPLPAAASLQEQPVVQQSQLIQQQHSLDYSNAAGRMTKKALTASSIISLQQLQQQQAQQQRQAQAAAAALVVQQHQQQQNPGDSSQNAIPGEQQNQQRIGSNYNPPYFHMPYYF